MRADDYRKCTNCEEIIYHDDGNYLDLTLQDGEDKSGFYCDNCGNMTDFVPETEDQYIVKFLWKKPTTDVFSTFFPLVISSMVIDYLPSFEFYLAKCNYFYFEELQYLACRAVGCGTVNLSYGGDDKDIGEPRDDQEWLSRAWDIITKKRKQQKIYPNGILNPAEEIFTLISNDARELVGQNHNRWFEIPLNKEEECKSIVQKIKNKEEELLEIKNELRELREELKIAEADDNLAFLKWNVKLSPQSTSKRRGKKKRREELF